MVQAKQELKPFVTGSSKKLELALSTQLLKNCSFEQVKDVLRKIMMKIGLRSQNLPTDIEKLVIYEHIIENFGGNRLGEIELAFNMAISGTLPDENGEVVEVNCYENFSCLYFSKIMTAYRRWSVQEYKHVVNPEMPEQKIFTQQELDDSAREDVERQYSLFKAGIEIKGYLINEPILRQDGLLNESETVLEFFARRSAVGALNIYVKA